MRHNQLAHYPAVAWMLSAHVRMAGQISARRERASRDTLQRHSDGFLLVNRPWNGAI
jgi:hypothetical protein